LKIKKATVGLDATEEKLLEAAEAWHEFNPMIGTRGVRLGVVKPGLYAMQVRALMEAAAARVKKGGNPVIEVMIPLTVTREELACARGWCEEAITEAKSKMDPKAACGSLRRDCRRGRFLLLRHQRPHPDDIRLQPRRR
jgi:pyruvate, orthophosphate dikinase